MPGRRRPFVAVALVVAGIGAARGEVAEGPGTVLGQTAAAMAPGTLAELPTLDLNGGILEDVKRDPRKYTKGLVCLWKC